MTYQDLYNSNLQWDFSCKDFPVSSNSKLGYLGQLFQKNNDKLWINAKNEVFFYKALKS